MNIIFGLCIIYVTYYTVTYAIIVWKEGNKAGGICIGLLAAIIVLIPLMQIFLK